MSFDQIKHSVTLEAAADLSTKQYHAVSVNSSGKAALCDADDYVAGILQNNPGSGRAATVTYNGVSKVKLGGTVAAGARVTVNASGQIVAATTGDSVLGIALAGGASGEIGTVLIGAAGVVAAAAVS
jgi:hypothetical protein